MSENQDSVAQILALISENGQPLLGKDCPSPNNQMGEKLYLSDLNPDLLEVSALPSPKCN